MAKPGYMPIDDMAIATPSVTRSMKGIQTWMVEQGAAGLVKNLRGPCDEQTMAAVVAELGKELPGDLRELYRSHDGNESESNPFLPGLVLAGLQMKAHRQRFLDRFVRSEFGVLGYAEHWEDWGVATLYPEELTERWWVLGSRDSDYLVMNLDSQRVFWAGKSSPPLSLAANNLRSFFAHYLARLRRGDYRVDTESSGELSWHALRESEPWRVPAPDTTELAEAFVADLSAREWIATDEAPSRETLLRLEMVLEVPVSSASRVEVEGACHVEGIVEILDGAGEIADVYATNAELLEAIDASDVRRASRCR